MARLLARDARRRFRDREDAGRSLAALCGEYAGRADVVVLALPRGGVPVGYEVALSIGAPLDVFLVRKLGHPGHEELAMGAVASGGVVVLNEDVVRGIAPHTLASVEARERLELARRESTYRRGRPPLVLAGRLVLLVDDGLATGASMRAAVEAVRRQHPARVVVAVPVAPRPTCEELARSADQVICARMPSPFGSVGTAYDDFRQTSDDEVVGLLARAAVEHGAPPDDR